MVRKIKVKKPARKAPQSANQSAWWVPFDAEGRAAVYIHKHGDSNDHSGCGPVVMCCERAVAPYEALAPDLIGTVDEYKWQGGDHLCRWLDNGVPAMYFVLCDPGDPRAIYQFGLPADAARKLLLGRVSHGSYRRPECRHVADGLEVESSSD